MALQPGNTSFVPGDLLTAQQYNITHNTVNKLAIEDNSRVVYPGSFPPANIASGHWVIAALAGDYSNYPGITSTSVLSPSVLVYDSSINEWDVYPLAGVGDSTIGIYNPSVQYKVNDIVIYNDIDSVLAEYRYEYIYRCSQIAFPDQSPELVPSKWVRQGLFVDTDSIVAVIDSLDNRLTSVELELTNKLDSSLLASPNGIATLDSDGKVNSAQLPSLLINDTYIVNSEAEMLNLVAVKGDIAVRTDIEKTFILSAEPSSNINNWVEILASYDRVISVNGLGGIVTLTTSNIPEGSNLYFSDSRVNNNTNVAANTAKRHDQVTIGTPNGLLLNGQELSLKKASITETGALSSEDWLTFNNKQDTILQGPVDSYYRGDKTWQTLNTASVVESTNLYFTQSRVLNTSIGNFIEIDVAITAGDSIATALNKLQTQVNNRIATVSKEQIEAVLTGNITSHAHDIYLTDAPIDNKQYARKDGSWVEVQEGGQGTTEHNLLTLASRGLPDQHPISSITGLSSQLTNIEGNISVEILNREQEDANIRLSLSAETSNRIAADTAIIDSLGVETLNRETNDNLIRQDLNIEISNRTSADTSILSLLNEETAFRIAGDSNLQHQIFEIVENSPIDIVRFFLTTQITILGQTYNLSSETKGTVAATPITVSVTGTDRATSNRIARFIGDTPLTVERLIPVQNTQIFIRANKNNTNKLVYIYFDFYDYAADGTTTLKGSTSDVLLTNTEEVYNLLLQVAEYTAQIGARSLVDCRTYQTGSGVAAQTTISIAGDYASRFQYKLPAGSLSFLDEKLISTQDLPSLNLLSGATQKEVNAAQDLLNTDHEQRLDNAETQLAGNQLTFAAIYGYYNFI